MQRRIVRITRSFRKLLNVVTDKETKKDNKEEFKDYEVDKNLKEINGNHDIGLEGRMAFDTMKSTEAMNESEYENTEIKEELPFLNDITLAKGDEGRSKNEGGQYLDDFVFSVVERLHGSCTETETILDRLQKTHFTIDSFLTNLQVNIS